MITSHILCHLQVTGSSDTKTKCASCKHLTKIFGSNHPAIDYLSAFVYCSLSEIVLSVLAQLWASTASKCVYWLYISTYVHTYVIADLCTICPTHVLYMCMYNCCNCEFKMKNPLMISQWKCKVYWECKWYCTWLSDKRCNRSCTTLFVSHDLVCVRVCVSACAEGLVGAWNEVPAIPAVSNCSSTYVTHMWGSLCAKEHPIKTNFQWVSWQISQQRYVTISHLTLVKQHAHS